MEQALENPRQTTRPALKFPPTKNEKCLLTPKGFRPAAQCCSWKSAERHELRSVAAKFSRTQGPEDRHVCSITQPLIFSSSGATSAHGLITSFPDVLLL